MKFLLYVLTIFFCVHLNVLAENQKQTFLCTGWTPFYNENAEPLNSYENSKDGNLLITVDKQNQTVSASLPTYGTVLAPLSIKDDSYNGNVKFTGRIGKSRIVGINFHIDRYTAKADISYETDRSDGIGYVAFMGDCRPAQRKF